MRNIIFIGAFLIFILLAGFIQTASLTELRQAFFAPRQDYSNIVMSTSSTACQTSGLGNSGLLIVNIPKDAEIKSAKVNVKLISVYSSVNNMWVGIEGILTPLIFNVPESENPPTAIGTKAIYFNTGADPLVAATGKNVAGICQFDYVIEFTVAQQPIQEAPLIQQPVEQPIQQNIQSAPALIVPIDIFSQILTFFQNIINSFKTMFSMS